MDNHIRVLRLFKCKMHITLALSLDLKGGWSYRPLPSVLGKQHAYFLKIILKYAGERQPSLTPK